MTLDSTLEIITYETNLCILDNDKNKNVNVVVLGIKIVTKGNPKVIG